MVNGRGSRGLSWLVLPLALGAGLGCAEPETPAPEATAVGEPLPGAVTASATIGPQGGTLASADGIVTISIPEGALGADTLISVVPITNLGHGGIGPAAYRMTGTETFLKPVSLTFSWTEEELEGAAPEFLEVAFQTPEGFWQLLDTATVDTSAKTITATTTHFTDFLKVKGFRILPTEVTLKVNGAQRFQLEWAYPLPGREGDRLGFGWAKPGVVIASRMVDGWLVNGIKGGNDTIGTVYPDIDRGGYAAPESTPSPDTVTVGVRLINVLPPRRGGVFTAQVRIVDELPVPDAGITTYAGTFNVTNPSYTVAGNVVWTQSSSSPTKFIASGEAQVDYTGCATFSGKRPIYFDPVAAAGNGELTFIGSNHSWSLSVVPFEVSCNGQTVPVNFGPLGPCNAVSYAGSIEQGSLSGSGSCGTENYTWSFTKQQ